MDWHPTDDDLILLFYEDGSALELQRIRTHVDSCAECRRKDEELRAALSVVSDAECPEPVAGFDARLWARIQPELPARTARWSAWQVLPVLAWAATVSMTVGLGYLWSRSVAPEPATAPETAEAQAPDLRERVLLSALDQHFDQTETLLVELLNSPDDEAGAFAFERATAGDLVSSGRLYRETAYQTGDRRFADVLDDLESVLVEVARSPDEIDRDDVNLWRSQIEDHSLLFKVRAVTHEIRERQDELTPAIKGAL